jgi:cysteine dioxygenase
VTSTGLISLDEFVAAVLGYSEGDFPIEPMTRLLTQARVRDTDVARYAQREDGATYSRVLIHRTPEIEILALVWSANGATPIHDHAGQRCWMVAHSGVFVIEDYRQVAGSRAPGHAVVEHVRTTENVSVGMPDVRYDSDRDIHRVSVAPGSDGAVSLHVYAKPYTSCLIFDEAGRSAREMRVDTFSPF